jgi:HD-GYP domain-containing protein (c-di-GMP phosphodiesterase class II)
VGIAAHRQVLDFISRRFAIYKIVNGRHPMLLRSRNHQSAIPRAITDEDTQYLVESAEKGRRQLISIAIALILVLTVGVLIYALNFERLNGLFNSNYFNNMVRISLSLLILAFIGYLAVRERNYSRQSQAIFHELNASTKSLQTRLDDLTDLLEISKLVAIADDLHATLEGKMPHMKGHWKRVSFYAAEIARHMELDDDYVRLIERAANLMDIGMIQATSGLAEDALTRGELEEGEREIIKRHPLIGADMLSAIRPNWEIIPLVRSHHEWWNGMGYPDGLKGEAIPLGARILAVADSFVAMTSWRSYHEMLDAREAAIEINAYSGVQFDPKVVNNFLAVVTPRIYGTAKDSEKQDELELLREINGIIAGSEVKDPPEMS